MDPALFRCGESLLLLGEGNFSFARSLVQQNLPVDVTATCFESVTDLQVEAVKSLNIAFLTRKGCRVLSEVDGTKLNEHPILGNEHFSKIIFNFPHVGGKMKISLNRKLLKDLFRSVSVVLKDDGHVFITLCKGQGGTETENVSRKWEDSWQVVEMAAQSDFVLCDIEPFRLELAPNYSSVGYRSRDLAFHTEHALVHIFKKVPGLYPNQSLSMLLHSIEHKTLATNHGNVICPGFFVTKYKNYLANNDDAPINILFKRLLTVLNDHSNNGQLLTVKYISDNDVPVQVHRLNGSRVCLCDGTEIRCELRSSLLDIIDTASAFWFEDQKSVVVFPGLVFHKLGNDFSSPPLSNHVLILGHDVSNLLTNYINSLLRSADDNSFCSKITRDGIVPSALPFVVVSKKCELIISANEREIVVGQTYCIKLKKSSSYVEVPASVVYMDKLAEVVFHLQNWRELWADGARVVTRAGKMMFKPASLYPRLFTLDLCFSNTGVFHEEEMCDVLWQLGGDIITTISPSFNDFDSGEGWHSRCYRLTYQSFDRALYKNKARDIHLNIIGKTLCTKLGLKMH